MSGSFEITRSYYGPFTAARDSAKLPYMDEHGRKISDDKALYLNLHVAPYPFQYFWIIHEYTYMNTYIWIPV